MEQVAAVGDARHPADNIGIDFCGHAGAGVEDREGVTHGTVGQAGDELCTTGRQL